MNFHEETIDKIVNRLERKKGRYLFVLKNVQYNISEMDIVAVTPNNYMLVFEVKSKSSFNYRQKAYEQLDKHKKQFGDVVDRMFRFYVHPDGKDRHNYKIEWIRPKKIIGKHTYKTKPFKVGDDKNE